MSRYEEALNIEIQEHSIEDRTTLEYGFYEKYQMTCIDTIKEMRDKAKQYDTISKQLGCPLEVVFKALKEGFYTQNNHHTKQDNTWLGINDLGYCKEIFCMYFDENMANIVSCVEVDTRDYGKTWWLKGEKK